MRFVLIGLLAIASCLSGFAAPSIRVLAFYSEKTEADHVAFAEQAIAFFSQVAKEHKIAFETTTRWENWDVDKLRQYRLVLWLNDSPHTQAEREAFESYAKAGGAWLGFHAAAYNDQDTHWPWFVDFLGGAVFYSNNWPPLPAKLTVDDPKSSLTANLPTRFIAPVNEWYIWLPSPRLNPDVKVLLSFDPSNYPLGFKDVLLAGDLPVVWTNRKYKMIYLNMGHGDKIFTTGTQNKLLTSAFLWFTREGNVTF